MDRLGKTVRAELGRFGSAAEMVELVAAWPRLVGPSIARNAWPARLDRSGRLDVHAASAAWAFELNQLAPAILERLRGELRQGSPTALRFVVGPIPEPSASDPRAAPPAPVEPCAADTARAESLAAPIADEELRKVVANAAARALARGPSDRVL